eukprot:3138283-Prymnesium_polylepis.2
MSPSMTACGDYGSIDHLAPSAGLYHLCAAVHHAVLPVPAGVWERLDTVQRNLWFIDEIEARWQRVVTQARSPRARDGGVVCSPALSEGPSPRGGRRSNRGESRSCAEGLRILGSSCREHPLAAPHSTRAWAVM